MRKPVVDRFRNDAGASQLGDLRTNVILSSVSALFTTGAAVLAVLLIQRIDELQSMRPWVPWWAAGTPHNGFQPPAR